MIFLKEDADTPQSVKNFCKNSPRSLILSNLATGKMGMEGIF
jgi:hypothetical protein